MHCITCLRILKANMGKNMPEGEKLPPPFLLFDCKSIVCNRRQVLRAAICALFCYFCTPPLFRSAV